jgi:uncharacterized membrane-anchored protein
MQPRHVPAIDRRYWSGILLASVFGTNLGDFYAHASGLGLGLGLLLLALIFAADYLIEPRDESTHEIHYWVAIIVIRTGATNIADFLAYRVRVPALLLAALLAALIAVPAWLAAHRGAAARSGRAGPVAKTDLTYWGGMLAAGVFGTVTGDLCAHHVGQGPASVGLTVTLAILLGAAGSRPAGRAAIYWCAVALARTAGTCIGDWLAENRILHLGLPLSTLLTGCAFVAVLALWRGSRRQARAAA